MPYARWKRTGENDTVVAGELLCGREMPGGRQTCRMMLGEFELLSQDYRVGLWGMTLHPDGVIRATPAAKRRAKVSSNLFPRKPTARGEEHLNRHSHAKQRARPLVIDLLEPGTDPLLECPRCSLVQKLLGADDIAFLKTLWQNTV